MGAENERGEQRISEEIELSEDSEKYENSSDRMVGNLQMLLIELTVREGSGVREQFKSLIPGLKGFMEEQEEASLSVGEKDSFAKALKALEQVQNDRNDEYVRDALKSLLNQLEGK